MFRSTKLPHERSRLMHWTKWTADFVDEGVHASPDEQATTEQRLGLPLGFFRSRPNAEQMDLVVEVIKQAPLYHMRANVCALIEGARADVPQDVLPAAHLFVSPGGLMFFDSPMSSCAQDDRPEGRWDIPTTFDAIGWGWIKTDFGVPGLVLPTWKRDEGNWTFLNVSMWLYDEALGKFNLGHNVQPHARADHIEDRALVLVANLLMTQEGILTDTPAPLAPKDRRRAARAGLPTAPVRVIDVKHGGGASTGTGHHLTKRFIVRGHWRNQACGPGHKLRRPMWINAHVKGPEDAPLDVRPTVWRVNG